MPHFKGNENAFFSWSGCNHGFFCALICTGKRPMWSLFKEIHLLTAEITSHNESYKNILKLVWKNITLFHKGNVHVISQRKHLTFGEIHLFAFLFRVTHQSATMLKPHAYFTVYSSKKCPLEFQDPMFPCRTQHCNEMIDVSGFNVMANRRG